VVLFASATAMAETPRSPKESGGGESGAGESSTAGDATGVAAGKPPTSPFADKPGYAHFYGSILGGTGLRFNNPYRLATPLGGDAQSLSRTNAYVDVGLGATFGPALGFQHGMTLRTSVSVQGVRELMLAPSYVLYRRQRAFAGYARLGPSFALAPTLNVGGETGLGGVWFPRGGIGLVAEGVFNLYYGAATPESLRPAYPVLSGQLGVQFDIEVLP